MRMKGKKPIFNYRDCWSMDFTLSPIIHAGIVKFREELAKHPCGGFPCDFSDEENDPMGENSMKEWLEVIDKMAYAFDEAAEPDVLDYDFTFKFNGGSLEPTNQEEYNRFQRDEAEHHEKRKEGLELFAKYFNNLWI